MSSSTAAPRMIILQASDGETFEVEEAVAAFSQTIKHMIEDDCGGTTFPVPNVTSENLSKVIEYCKRHVDVMICKIGAVLEKEQGIKAITGKWMKCFGVGN